MQNCEPRLSTETFLAGTGAAGSRFGKLIGGTKPTGFTGAALATGGAGALLAYIAVDAAVEIDGAGAGAAAAALGRLIGLPITCLGKGSGE